MSERFWVALPPRERRKPRGLRGFFGVFWLREDAASVVEQH